LGWLDSFFSSGIQTIYVNGVPLPSESGVNLIQSGATGADNPNGNRSDVTLSGSGGGSSLTPVLLSGPTSITAVAGNLYFVTVSAGAVTFATPTSPVLGTKFGLVIVAGPVTGTDKVTVNAAGATTVQEPISQSAPSVGVFGASAIFQTTDDLGDGAKVWTYDGVSKWVMT
jgi:hypothetical protein